MAFPRPVEVPRGVRAAVHRGVQPAARQACCPEPASPLAQVQVWLSGQARPGAHPALRVQETAWLWAPARDVSEEPLRAASERDALRAVPEVAVSASGEPRAALAEVGSVRAAAEPQPAAATAASGRQAVPAAEEEAPDASRAAAEVASGVTARPRAVAWERAAAQPQAAVRSDA